MSTKRIRLDSQNQADRVEILDELEAILQTSAFANSRRYPAFLRFAVETVLAGRGDELKERTLGVEVFNRPPDYDTNSDTVVRFTAGEVRKRLIAFYRETDAGRAVQIVLPTGSYAPEFYRADDEDAVPSERPRLFAPTEPTILESAPVKVQGPARTRKSIWVWLAAAAAVLVLATGSFWMLRPSGLNAFWRGVGPVGEPVLLTPGTVMVSGDPPALISADSTHKMVWMSAESAATLTSLGTRFGKDGRAYRIQPVANTTLADLRLHPAVLIGAYNNDWTMRLTAGLPFHFGPADHRGIFSADTPQRTWISEVNHDGRRTTDYAIVARYRDSLTENQVVVLAGLNKGGTEAASEFVTEGRYFDAARSQLPAGWEHKNVEFVLQTDLVGNTSSAPRVIAMKVW